MKLYCVVDFKQQIVGRDIVGSDMSFLGFGLLLVAVGSLNVSARIMSELRFTSSLLQKMLPSQTLEI